MFVGSISVSDFISDNGWTPTNVIFTFIIPGNDGNDVTRQTKNSSLDLSDKNGVRYYCWGGKEWDSTEYRDKYLVSPVEYGGESNIVTTQSSVAGSQAVTETTKYTDPLYFGAFYMSNNENGYTATNKPGMSGGGKAGGPYNNFYWQSHVIHDNILHIVYARRIQVERSSILVRAEHRNKIVSLFVHFICHLCKWYDTNAFIVK